MKILLAAFSLIAFNALAVENLMDMKKMANESITKEMTTLQNDKTCINNASSVNAFKACNYSAGEMNKMQKQEKMMGTGNMEKDKMMDKSKNTNKSY